MANAAIKECSPILAKRSHTLPPVQSYCSSNKSAQVWVAQCDTREKPIAQRLSEPPSLPCGQRLRAAMVRRCLKKTLLVP